MEAIRIDLPSTCKEIRAKVAAFRELFGSDPIVQVAGVFRCQDGETAFLEGLGPEVVQIASRYVYVRLEGESQNVGLCLTGVERGRLILKGAK